MAALKKNKADFKADMVALIAKNKQKALDFKDLLTQIQLKAKERYDANKSLIVAAA